MTHEFTKEDWNPINGNFAIRFDITNPLEDKPIIQVYFYPDEATYTTSILMDVKQVEYIEAKNVIELINGKPFNGYIVIK